MPKVSPDIDTRVVRGGQKRKANTLLVMMAIRKTNQQQQQQSFYNQAINKHFSAIALRVPWKPLRGDRILENMVQ